MLPYVTSIWYTILVDTILVDDLSLFSVLILSHPRVKLSLVSIWDFTSFEDSCDSQPERPDGMLFLVARLNHPC